jgi:hypothetical protein
MANDSILDALNQREKELLAELNRVRAAKKAYKTGAAPVEAQSQPRRRRAAPKKARPEGTIQDDVFKLLPEDGGEISIDDVMDGLKAAGKNHPRSSAIAALSVLATRKKTVSKLGRGKYARTRALGTPESR